MKVSHILDSLVHPLCVLTAGIVFTIPISICACIPILGWFGIGPLARKANSMSDSLYNKYKMSEFRSRLNIESSQSKSKTNENQSSSLKDEDNTRQALAQDAVTMQETIELKKEPKKVKKPAEKTNEIKTKKKGQDKNKVRNWLIRFIIIMILWYPYYEFRFYLHSEGMRWEDISLLSIAVVGIILFISKHITNFILSSLFKDVNENYNINQNELENKKEEQQPLQETSKIVKEKKGKSKIYFISLIILITITVIITAVKMKELKERKQYKENQALSISKQKIRIAKEKAEKERLAKEKAQKNILITTRAFEKAEKERLAKEKAEKEKLVIKNAEYYLELASDRMKVDESGRFDMTNKDWDYVVENINKCLDLDSDFLLAYLFRGNAYYYMQEYRKSMKDYKKITRVRKYRFESTEELSLLSMAYIGLGNAKLKLKLNYCREYKKACDLGDCLEYYELCK